MGEVSDVGTIRENSVHHLSFSVRAHKAFDKLGIDTIGQLVRHTEADLMGVRGFGVTSLSEVRQRLADHGLALREPLTHGALLQILRKKAEGRGG
jgi:DNA-directed RNA polymerase subunit alpha